MLRLESHICNGIIVIHAEDCNLGGGCIVGEITPLCSCCSSEP